MAIAKTTALEFRLREPDTLDPRRSRLNRLSTKGSALDSFLASFGRCRSSVHQSSNRLTIGQVDVLSDLEGHFAISAGSDHVGPQRV